VFEIVEYLINVLFIKNKKPVSNMSPFSGGTGMCYRNVLFVAEPESLKTRRNNIYRSFFQDICEPNCCLYHLIPPARDTSFTTRPRRTTLFPRPVLRTKTYWSFI